MVGVPNNPDTQEAGSWLGGIFRFANKRLGIGSDTTDGFLTEAKRKELEDSLTESQKTEAADIEKKIMQELIAKFEKSNPGGSEATTLKGYLASGDAPEIISDVAKLGVQQGGELGILDYAEILVTSVVESITGNGGEVYNQAGLGFFGRIQANIAERGSEKYADALYGSMLKYAAEKGGDPEVERIKDLVSKHDIRGAAFMETAERVGLEVKSSQLVGVYRPKENEGPGIS